MTLTTTINEVPISGWTTTYSGDIDYNLKLGWRKFFKVLVTGGGGYIGSILVPELLKRGHKVTVLDNFTYGQASLFDCCSDENLMVIRGDVRDEELLAKCMEGVDFIFPLAALVGDSICMRKPWEAWDINYHAVKKMLKWRDNQKIIFPCTNSGYGVGMGDIYCTEETPLNPISVYGKSKVEAEKAVIRYGNAISLRLATVFGMSLRMRIDLMVNDFVYRAVTDGFLILYESHFKRNYIHVRDVAKAFIHAMDNFDSMKDEVYNVGLSSANLSKWELCEEIKKQVPNFYFVEAEVGKDPDQRNYIVSNEKIEKTGWKPDYTLQWGIAELIKGYQIIKRNQYSNNV